MKRLLESNASGLGDFELAESPVEETFVYALTVTSQSPRITIVMMLAAASACGGQP